MLGVAINPRGLFLPKPNTPSTTASERRSISGISSRFPRGFQFSLFWYAAILQLPDQVTDTNRQPQRALTYVKKSTPKSDYEAAYLACLETMWKRQLDISKPEHLATALRRVFLEGKVQEILTEASNPKIKAELTAVTEKVVKEQGAFGCPWFWVKNAQGQEEPFFGSDRFHYMWRYLGLPFEDIKLKSRI